MRCHDDVAVEHRYAYPSLMTISVEALGLVKTFEGKKGSVVEAVRGVDLRVESGEVFGFLGPNGAGKSTTVRMLTTLTTITAGTARVAGVDVASDPDGVRRRIGVALQERWGWILVSRVGRS